MGRYVVFALAFQLLSGCIVSTSPRPVYVQQGHGSPNSRANRECPPAHHWDGARCVHNGNGAGNGNGNGRGNGNGGGNGHGHGEDHGRGDGDERGHGNEGRGHH